MLAGTLSPVFFASALTNFGVEPFLREFVELAPPPTARESTNGLVNPADPSFTGFVFKIQANMDPKHRDRIAFVRICSGRFEPGLQVTHVRTGKPMRLSSAQQFLARERSAVEEAWPGDVIGVMDRGTLRIGDTLSADGELEFSGIPRFAPEHFARIVATDPLKRKQLDAGLRQLTEEGAAQVFYTSGTDTLSPTPIVGAVGLLQFDVMLHRLEHEYGAPCRLEKITARYPALGRRCEGRDRAHRARPRTHAPLRREGASAHPVRGCVGTEVGARPRDDGHLPRSGALRRNPGAGRRGKFEALGEDGGNTPTPKPAQKRPPRPSVKFPNQKNPRRKKGQCWRRGGGRAIGGGHARRRVNRRERAIVEARVAEESAARLELVLIAVVRDVRPRAAEWPTNDLARDAAEDHRLGGV